MSNTRRIAVVGLGSMGGAMASTLHRAGWDVTGFDPHWTSGLQVTVVFQICTL